MKIRTFIDKRLPLIALVLFPWLVVYGQSPGNLKFNHITENQGLSQSSGNAILQDSQGFMWFGTNDGLNKYDGFEMTVYKHNSDDSTTISGNNVSYIYEDGRKNLWIGTTGEGLNLFNREKETFTSFRHNYLDPDVNGISNNSISSILEDSRGRLWIGTDHGLNYLNRNTGKFGYFFADSTDHKSLSNNMVRSLYEDSDGNLWIGTAEGLNLWDYDNQSFKIYRNNTSDPHSISSNSISAIYEDKKENLWIGTTNGLNRLDRETGTFYRYLHEPGNPRSISGNAILSILEDSKGILWIGTENSGLNAFDRKSGLFYHYTHDLDNPHSISNNAVYSIYENKDQILFVGTYSGGINYLDRKDPKFEHYYYDQYSDYPLSTNSVTSFLEDSRGNLWIGTDDGGLNRFDRETKQFYHMRHEPGKENSLSSDVVLALIEDSLGYIWIGYYSGGISRYDPERNTFRHFTHQPDDPHSLCHDDVFVLYEDREGDLWAGTNGGGVCRYNRRTGTFTKYQVQEGVIRDIYEDTSRNFWIAEYGGGLKLLDRETGEFWNFYTGDYGLRSNVVLVVQEDQKGNLWLGTGEGGLHRFNFNWDNLAFTAYNDEMGLPSNVVKGILIDDKGNLWLSTNNGISRFNPETETFTNYGVEDGVQGNEFNTLAYYEDSEGYMYFGGINGFNRFHPDSIKTNPEVPPVVLTDFQVSNRSMPIGGENSPLDRHISQTDHITLSHKASVLTFLYAALDYNQHKGNQFAYKMEGFDEEWNYVGDIRRATYTNLNPGRYTFRVKVANNDGVWNDSGVSLTVVITPPFWRTTWFLFLMALALAGIIYLIYWLRVHAIRKRNRLLATTITERTAELKKANTTKDKLFSIIAHDLINISTGLSGLSGLMKESLEQENIKEANEYSGHLHNTISQFATMLKNMLDWARSQTGRIQYDPINFHLVDIVDEIIDQQESNAIYKNIKLTSSVDKDLEVFADPDMILVILRNLIGNALKFTAEGGKIEVTARSEDDSVRISVKDNGIGISEEIVHKIFDHDETVTTLGTSNEKGTGLGISLCKDFIRRNKGILSAESEPGVGTTISFTLPFAQEMEAYSGDIFTQAS